ncbi:stage V sporulation protein AB [Virgibacillus sp. W0181]|uniref:stage V sporulation protein AB n=1 Tax=Virgibacillus sp. W0181 TaxID=3391581 RepID=UPI003F44DAD4
MIKIFIINIFEAIIGFAGGLAVGSGFVAIITVLGIIPRLIQLSRANHLVKVYGACALLGTLFGTYLSFINVAWNNPVIVLIVWGVFHGIFNGMLAAALTEVLNVFPILSKRLGVSKYIMSLLMAIVFGKIFGSLFQWIILSR